MRTVNKIITFLGIDKYQPTTYHYGVKQFGPESYFAVALAKFFPDYQIIVLATPEAQQEHARALQNQLGHDPVCLRIVPVPEPVNEDELWNTFEIIQRQVRDGDQLVFDITHSFRSLPFLAFLALAYLRVVRQFCLEAVLYAPYQRYDKSEVHDLRRFVDLLDWTTATHLFLKTGHAAPLVRQLERSEWSRDADADELERTSAGLRLARPDEARRLAHAWAQTLEDLDPESDLSTHARPFGLLLKRVQKEFQRITPQKPDFDNLEQELAQELELIRWNINRGQVMSAVTVAREWLVSLMCWHAGWTDLIKERDREGKEREIRRWRSERRADKCEVLNMLNHLAELERLSPAEREKRIGSVKQVARDLWRGQPDYAELLGHAWEQVSKLRDDLSHAGKVHSTAPRSLDTLLRETQQVPDLLEMVFDRSGLKTPEQS